MKARRLQEARKKESEIEKVKKSVIKKEMQDHVEKGKKERDITIKELANKKGCQKKPQWNPCVKVTDQLNSYTGPMKLGKQIAPPVKQIKTIVGGTTIKSAPFLAHGKKVITSASLTKVIDKTATNAKWNTIKEKASATEKGKNP